MSHNDINNKELFINIEGDNFHIRNLNLAQKKGHLWSSKIVSNWLKPFKKNRNERI